MTKKGTVMEWCISRLQKNRIESNPLMTSRDNSFIHTTRIKNNYTKYRRRFPAQVTCQLVHLHIKMYIYITDEKYLNRQIVP